MQEKLTIIMPTFNKQDYISDALDSILSQNVNFKYRLIIADDYSTDNTLNIVDKYKARFDCMEVLTSEKNQGLFYNIVRAYGMLDTEYFCVLDPDDYYTDNDFLQESVDFLQSNLDYNVYSSNTLLQTDSAEKPFSDINSLTTSCFQDMLEEKVLYGQTAGCVYRNTVFKYGLPQKLKCLQSESCVNSFRSESFRNYIHAESGKIYFNPKCVAVYRVTDSGLWQTSSSIKRCIFNANYFKDMYFYFDCKYDELLYISYKHFLYIEKNIFDLIKSDMNIDYIRQLIELKKALQDNYDIYAKVCNNKYSKMRFRDKIRLKMFGRLETILKNKGIIL